MVVGASAAGLLAAIFAARAGARVVAFETRAKPGAKIRVSGGGRCNLLPGEVSPADYHTSGSPRRLRNILLSWPLEEVRAFFEVELGIPLKREPTGKLFPVSERPLDVVEALLRESEQRGVELRTGTRVTEIDRRNAGFVVAPTGTGAVEAQRVVLATGGLSLPKTGSDGTGFALARALGHDIVPTFPVLVPLTSSDATWAALAGISVAATVRVRDEGALVMERTGSFLFTHRGFSGPVVLDVSRAAHPRAVVEVHWGGAETPWPDLLRTPGPLSVGRVLRDALPRRLAERLLARAGVPAERRTAELRRAERRALETELVACRLPIDGNEGYRTAEATGGGIPLADVQTKSLESRITPGLHFAGEMLDVDGRIGGYNFLWAFVTGRRAGRAAGLRALAANG